MGEHPQKQKVQSSQDGDDFYAVHESRECAAKVDSILAMGRIPRHPHTDSGDWKRLRLIKGFDPFGCLDQVIVETFK